MKVVFVTMVALAMLATAITAVSPDDIVEEPFKEITPDKAFQSEVDALMDEELVQQSYSSGAGAPSLPASAAGASYSSGAPSLPAAAAASSGAPAPIPTYTSAALTPAPTPVVSPSYAPSFSGNKYEKPNVNKYGFKLQSAGSCSTEVTEEQCMNFAGSVVYKPYATETDDEFAKGCYFYNTDSVYFNRASAGTGCSRRDVCVCGTPASPQTPGAPLKPSGMPPPQHDNGPTRATPSASYAPPEWDNGPHLPSYRASSNSYNPSYSNSYSASWQPTYSNSYGNNPVTDADMDTAEAEESIEDDGKLPRGAHLREGEKSADDEHMLEKRLERARQAQDRASDALNAPMTQNDF